MPPSFMDKQRIYTVSELSFLIKDLLESSIPPVWVSGEISNFSRSRKGHIYFSLKDENSLINCVIWKSFTERIPFNLQDGMSVLIYGKVVVYPPQSQYQVRVYEIKPIGEGNLYLKFQLLKEKLQKEGLFDAERKKELPLFPRKVGVVTSITGAAIRDILNISGRRNPSVEIIIFPAQVQGVEAADTIVEGIKFFNERVPVDLIIVGRGGGSLEDLWAFNEEKVVRAIADSEIPVISAVGHEVDFSLSDSAADYRAPTPSAAAEVAFPSRDEIINSVDYYIRRLQREISSLFSSKQDKYKELKNRLVRLNPIGIVQEKFQRLDELENRMLRAMSKKFEINHLKLKELTGKLTALSPRAILKRGYSIVFKLPEKSIVKSTQDVRIKDRISVEVLDGNFKAVVTKN